MITERIKLLEGREDAYLDVYARSAVYETKRPAMLVIPGGGYGGVCGNREGEPIAMLYMAEGFNTFVLHYPCAPNTLAEDGTPLPLIVASKAMAHIKRNADKYSIDPEKVSVIGFSAGGHLAGSLATMWHHDFVAKAAGIEYGENRPSAAILSYAVISSDPAIAHMGSFKNLIAAGGTPDEKSLELYSLENRVTDKTPPTFLWHTAGDTCVPVENSLVMASALSSAKVPFELHIYPGGWHGFASCKWDAFGEPVTEAAKHAEDWVSASVKWLKTL